MNRARQRRSALFLAFVCAAGFGSASARAADESALIELGRLQVAKPDDHEALIKACENFAAAHPGDPLLPVARGFQEWHLLRSGHRDEALQMMTADLTLPKDPVGDGARRLAQAWLTRADRDQVVTALQVFYRQQVGYPKTLEELPQTRPPLEDRFGKQWSYRLSGFAKLAGFDDQRYSLQSTALGGMSDFNKALQLPYAAQIAAVPVQVIAIPGNAPAVKFNLGGSASVVGLGQSGGDLFLAFVGARILVVCDYTHWKILPHP